MLILHGHPMNSEIIKLALLATYIKFITTSSAKYSSLSIYLFAYDNDINVKHC